MSQTIPASKPATFDLFKRNRPFLASKGFYARKLHLSTADLDSTLVFTWFWPKN